MKARPTEKVAVTNVNHPNHGTTMVDATLYRAVRRAYLAVLPRASPGLTLADVASRLRARLPESLFPGGARAGWWAKTVQLDLEARGLVKREKTRPIRLHKI